MRDLPKSVYYKHGAYYFVKNNTWHRLGRDRERALRKHRAILNNVDIGEQEKADVSAALKQEGASWFIGENDILWNAVEAPPTVCGVYFLIQGRSIMYVGQSKNIAARIGSHASSIYKHFDRYSIIKCEEADLDLVESMYIQLLSPPWNTASGRHHNAAQELEELIENKREELGLS